MRKLKSNSGYITMQIAVVVAHMGCAADVTPSTESDGPMAAKHEEALVLNIELSDTHKVQIWERGPGDVSIRETGLIDKDTTAIHEFTTTSKLYTDLVRQADPKMLTTLAELDERISRLNEDRVALAPPSAFEAEDAVEPSAELIEKAWFDETFCGFDDWGGGWHTSGGIVFNQMTSNLPTSWPGVSDRSRSTAFAYNTFGGCGIHQDLYKWFGTYWGLWDTWSIAPNFWQSVIMTDNQYWKWQAKSATGQCWANPHDHCVLLSF